MTPSYETRVTRRTPTLAERLLRGDDARIILWLIRDPAAAGIIISGYAAVLRSVGPARNPNRADQIRADRTGSVRAGAAADDVRALLNHNPDLLLGRTSSGTLRLWEDARGLRYEIHPPDTEAGRTVAELIRRGDLTGASFAFKMVRQQLTTERRGDRIVTVRSLLECSLGDVSIATFAAYAGATATLSAPLADGSTIDPPADPATDPAAFHRLALARRRLAMMRLS